MARKTGKGYEKAGNRFRVMVPARGDVKRHYQSFETEEEAQQFVARRRSTGSIEALIAASGVKGISRATQVAMERAFAGERQTPTVAELGRELVDDSQIRLNTRRTYQNALSRVLQDEEFAGTEVGAVTSAQVRRFFKGMDTNRENVRRLLAKVFNQAIRDGAITVSPLRQAAIKGPKKNGKLRPGDPRVLDADQVEQLARAAGNDRDALAIRLGAYVGLRAGEVGGLRSRDVDVERCTIHVRRNAQRREGGGVEMGDPKTATSERSLRVPCSLVEDVERYANEHGVMQDGTLLRTSHGNAMTDQPLTKAVVTAAKKAGLPRVTFHDLRHTCASLLIAAKLEPKAIQEYLGHATLAMTYDTYGALFEGADQPIADTMGALRAAAERKALPAGSE
jgi:integrase